MRLVALLCLFALPALADWTHLWSGDPNGALYDDLEVFEARGLTGPLPALQPYPLALVQHILQNVARHERATDVERRRAHWLLARIGDGLPHAGIATEARASSSSPGPYLFGTVAPDWQIMALPWLSLTSHIRVSGVRLADGLVLPNNVGNPEDFISDVSDVDINGERIDVRQISYGALAAGFADDDTRLFAQAGLLRHRMGPVWNNGVIVGGQAPVAGELSVMLQREFFTAHIALLELQATDDAGLGRSTGKHFFFHRLEVHPTSWLDVSLFETVITGRLELLYLLPATAYFHAQGLGGFADNSLVGVDARVRPVNDVVVKGVLYVDDIQFNDMVRGVFNTKYKLAAQAQIAWSPRSSLALPQPLRLRLLSFDYTAVMPYMYSHINSTTEPFNVENYTNGGQNFGPALEPNSDRFTLRTLWRILDDPRTALVDVELGANVIRHGNASIGIIDGRDGSIFDDGYLDGVPTFQPPFTDSITDQPATRFLSQNVIETTTQLTAKISATLDGGDVVEHEDGLGFDRGWGSVTATLDATWQLRDNAFLVAGARNVDFFVGVSLAYRY